MSFSSHRLLWLTTAVLRGLSLLNALFGVGILVLLIASLSFTEVTMDAIGVPADSDGVHLVIGMQVIMVLGVASIPFTHQVLKRIQQAVASIDSGDALSLENAARFRWLAYAVLGIEALHAIIQGIATAVSTAAVPLDMDWRFSVTPLLAALLLFVLASVFEHGASMRDELAGTV